MGPSRCRYAGLRYARWRRLPCTSHRMSLGIITRNVTRCTGFATSIAVAGLLGSAFGCVGPSRCFPATGGQAEIAAEIPGAEQPASAQPASAHPEGGRYPQIVRIRSLEGDVRVMRGKEGEKTSGATWEKAVAGLPLATGYSLVTGEGRAEIEFEDASMVYLAANSALAFWMG